MNEEEEINTIIIYLEAKIDDAFKKAELVKEEYLWAYASIAWHRDVFQAQLSLGG